MSNRLFYFVSALLGIVTGFITIHSFFAHSWTSMIFWVVVGLIMLYFSPNRNAALWGSTVFGFLTIGSWLLSGFQGATSQFHSFLVLTLGLSVLGAVCGAAGAMFFYWLFRRS